MRPSDNANSPTVTTDVQHLKEYDFAFTEAKLLSITFPI